MPRPNNLSRAEIKNLAATFKNKNNNDAKIQEYLNDIQTHNALRAAKIADRDTKLAQVQALQDELRKIDQDVMYFDGGEFYAENKIVDRHYDILDGKP